MKARLPLVLCALVAAAGLAQVRSAAARVSTLYYYSLDEVFTTAVRFLRIDHGCQITDKDAQAAYLIFECKDGDKARKGSLELFRQGDGVRAQLTLPDEPRYKEEVFLSALTRKLRDERGPSSPPPAKKPPPPPDGGAAKGE